MNDLLQKHGCANVFTIPEGLKELMSDITREVLREQPTKIFDFIANYLSVLLITREHGILAVRILDDLCDCRPSVSEHLLQIGMEKSQAEVVAQVIKDEIEVFEPTEGKEKFKESLIMKKILRKTVLDEVMFTEVCQIIRNAYRDFWYRKKLMEQKLKVQPNEPWEIAAEHTLELYKKTKPSFSELTRATQKIQAAYRGYHARKNLLHHLKPKAKKSFNIVESYGPSIDTSGSRDIDLGPIIDIKVHEDDIKEIFNKDASEKLELKYDPMKAITHIEDEEFLKHKMELTSYQPNIIQSQVADLVSTKSSVEADIIPTGISIASVKAEQRQLSIVPEPVYIQDTDEYIRLSPVSDQHFSGTSVLIPNASFNEIPSEFTNDAAVLEETAAKEFPIEEIISPDVSLTTESTAKKVSAVEVIEANIVQEILEDILDYRTEGEGQSDPTVSVPSSSPDSDEEDAGILQTTGEDEGY